jgi:hypothetical protein
MHLVIIVPLGMQQTLGKHIHQLNEMYQTHVNLHKILNEHERRYDIAS